LGLLLTHLLPTKQAAAAVEQLLLPLGDLGRMDLIFTRELAERLLLFRRFQSQAEFEVGTPWLAFLGHTPLHNSVQTLYSVLHVLWSSFWG
jgi:hypothetical protein